MTDSEHKNKRKEYNKKYYDKLRSKQENSVISDLEEKKTQISETTTNTMMSNILMSTIQQVIQTAVLTAIPLTIAYFLKPQNGGTTPSNTQAQPSATQEEIFIQPLSLSLTR